MSLSNEAKTEVLDTLNKKDSKAVVASADGIVVSQDHQKSPTLVSDTTGILNSPTLYPSITSNSLGDDNKDLTALPLAHQPWLSIFSQNVPRPGVVASFPLPGPGACFENSAPLLYYSSLLQECLLSSSTASNAPGESLNLTQQVLIELHSQTEDESSRIRLLIQRVVDDFVADNSKSSATLSEVLLFAPFLDLEYYHKLLNCVIAEFETAKLLDLAWLQGMIQLVEDALFDYLEPDDLVRILVVLSSRLQETHQVSIKHSYYLTWALSRLLDVMVEGKVKDRRPDIDQEPLSKLFSQLKDRRDRYLKRLATYAFQGLMHVPSDESRRECMQRYTGNITMGLLGVTSVCKLDLRQIEEGADHLYKAAGHTYDVCTKIGDGAPSLSESDQGIWDSAKGGIFSVGRQLWYTSLREAQQHIRNGRLHDFNNFVFEAPCHDHIDFQWGICRLLGEIAVDPLWESSTRQQAVDFLAELYKNDSMWVTSEDIYHWILDILRMIVATNDALVSYYAPSVLRGLKEAGDTAKQQLYSNTMKAPLCTYPIQVYLPIPTLLTLLSRVLNIPVIEYDIFRLKHYRLEEQKSAIYIQPQAKPSILSSDDTLFPLMEKALEFLTGPDLVFLLLGDSGGGKSTFNLQLERTLWNSYKIGDPIPLYINLPSIDSPQCDMIDKHLRQYDFTDTQILELKQNRQFIVICDGYDESQLTSNIHFTNHFNQPGQWKVKMFVTCRTQYLSPDYRSRFVPQGGNGYQRSTSDLFQEAVIAPFTKEQIWRYVDIYVPLKPRTWRSEDYMDRLIAIPSLMDLVKNPFLLSLALEVLPGVTEGQQDLSTIKLTRVQLYDTFVQHWYEINKKRLEMNNALPGDDQESLSQLTDAGFVSFGINFSIRLAQAIFDKQNGNSVIQYVHFEDKDTWKAEFFGSQSMVRLLRESSPLSRTGNYYRFVHRSMLEYFFSRVIYNPTESDEEPQNVDTASYAFQNLDTNNPLFERDLLKEPSIINFLCDRVKLNPDFKHQLGSVIDLSKTDTSATVAATNAITIMVRADVSFNSANLQGIKVPGADLSTGQFDFAQFQGADLTGANLSNSWLRQADMSHAHMEGVRFGELPYLEMDESVLSCAYSLDGKMLGAALHSGIIYIYDTLTWTRMHRLAGHSYRVKSIVFSPDGQWLVSGSEDATVRLWDTSSGEGLLVMEGHEDEVRSIAISPCGDQITSGSWDRTVRLWDAQTGRKLFLLRGHTSAVMSVKYSPDGCQLVSGSEDGTIRFWDTKTGEPGVVLKPSSGKVKSIAFSLDGRWLAAGHEEGHLQLWDASTLEPGPILRGHTGDITNIDFSSNGQWIASSSTDQTVRLWEASTSALAAVLTGHNRYVKCVAFSPNGPQLVSGGDDCKLRLWEVGSSWSSFDPRDDGHVRWLAYSNDGRSIFSYHQNGDFRRWDASTGTSAPIPFKIPKKAIASRACALDGSQLAFGYGDGSIRLWNCSTRTKGPVLKEHTSEIKTMVYSPCHGWLVSFDASNVMWLWDLHELQHFLVDVDENLHGHIGTVIFSPTGSQFAVQTTWGIVLVFDTQSRQILSCLKLEKRITSFVYSHNGQQIATGTSTGRVYQWDVQSKEYGATLEGCGSLTQCISYSPCGKWIAMACGKTVEIWRLQLLDEVESWSKVHVICAFFDLVGTVAWNPSVPMELVTSTINAFLSSASGGMVQAWRMSIGESGEVIFKLVWGSNLGILYTEGATFKDAVGLSPIHQKLLVQRGALSSEEPYISTLPTSPLLLFTK